MASSLSVYNVTITNGNSNASPNDGFVDNLKIENYNISLVTTPSGLTLALSQAKTRANFRYIDIINQLSMVTNVYINNTNISNNATYKTEATSFGFEFFVERGDSALVTNDETSPGNFLTSVNCIKRCVARALVNNMYREAVVFDPTSTTSTGVFGATTSVIRYGHRIVSNFNIGSYAANIPTAESMIVVTQKVF
jgi:hypothetical protein